METVQHRDGYHELDGGLAEFAGEDGIHQFLADRATPPSRPAKDIADQNVDVEQNADCARWRHEAVARSTSVQPSRSARPC